MQINAQKPWLKNYLEGVPHEIDLAGHISIVDLIEESFCKFPDRIAIDSMGYKISYRQLDILSADFAAYLQTLGLEPGSRIGIMFPNVPQYIIAMLGTLRAGFVVVNINPLYTARELEHQLQDSGASIFVMLENFAHVYQEIADHGLVKKVIVSSLGETLGPKGVIINLVARHIKKLIPHWNFPCVKLNQALKIGAGHGFTKPTLAQDDIAFLQYTGGTTGVSKGAVLLHRNILANIIQIESWLEPALKGRHQQLVFLCALPMTHIFALTACGLLGMRKGGKLLLVANPRDITGFIKLLMKHPDINIFPGVNTLFHALIHRPEFSNVKLPNLLVTIGGGMAVQKKTAELWQKIMGVPIAQGYGLSETSPVVCVNTPFVKEFTGSIGMPVPSTDVLILDDDGIEVPFGTPGEICIKGPQVMAGYWNRPEETEQFITPEGYFKSGDIGTMSPEGYVQIVDRKKDMIVVAGFKVFPNEIEEVISLMPGVRECAVIGFPHRKLGEIVKAYIVKDKPELTEAQVIQYCKEQMTSYKRPRKIAFIDKMPKSNVGKILRRHLRDI
ncbi:MULTISPECIES: AMP-binding protein [unclassified Polynucleobacter]|jgi:long-chain acyl-CoA synthetase|uniref:AMP-binding protein n=1 Tax=unclassified Polynucleobacter TaxID=2640945 RepID=UPI000BD7E1A6|nr:MULTISPECIES: AMP-binding protein [unclassified Polynucleobacter]OYY21015.1 MAG: long-chain fatty acid--CoA ligase [Polynucleobacter sp. 35-46-11]OZA77730.1 MAG: long-chain fatty acid--CoA ligase [Polynucleobacter sp. 39-46-10]